MMGTSPDFHNPEEVNELLRSDYTKDDPPAENAPGENSKVMEARDRIFAEDAAMIVQLKELMEACSPPLGEEIPTEEWHSRLAIAITNLIRQENDDRDDRTPQFHRETIRKINAEHAQQINKLGDLINQLYLNFYYIRQIASVLARGSGEYSPEQKSAIANLIIEEASRSLQRITDHNQTSHYPSALIQKNERTTTEQH